jgi:hypothetical protein
MADDYEKDEMKNDRSLQEARVQHHKGTGRVNMDGI